MHYWYYGLLIVGLYVAYQLSIIGRVWLQLRKVREERQQCRQVERDAWPQAQLPILLEAEEALVALGFDEVHTQALTSAGLDIVAVEPVYVHAATQTYARVQTLCNPVGARYFDITFETVWQDGRICLSTNGATDSCLPPPLHYDLYCDAPSSLEALWDVHRERLQHKGRAAVAFLPASYVAHMNRTWEVEIEHKLSQGWLEPTHEQPEHWRYTLSGRWKWFWRMYAGSKNLRHTIDSYPADNPKVSAGQVAAECLAFDRWLESESTAQAGWRLKTSLLLLSVILFAIAWGVAFSWYTVPILLGVLLIHELGHIAGMWAFGYRDFQLLFLPFLGAAVLWKQEAEATPWQKFVIYLLGPLPGLGLGLGALWLGAKFNHDVGYNIGMLALVLNYLNLLPFLPLDGGHIVNTLFLHRFPRAQFGLVLLSCIAFSVGFWWTQHPLFALIALVCALSLPETWQWGTVVQRFHQTRPSSDHPDDLLQATLRIFNTPPFNQKPMILWYKTVQRLWHHTRTHPTPWRLTLAGTAVYTLSLILPLYASPIDVFYRFGLASVYQTLHGVAPWQPTEPEPILDYTCPVVPPNFSAEVAAATLNNLPVRVVATFDNPEVIPEAMAWLEALPQPPDHLVQLGNTVVATVFQELIPSPETYHETLQALGANVLFEHVEADPYWQQAPVIYMTCKAPEAETAARLKDEIELYQSAPSGAYLSPPWYASAKLSEAQQRARRTYALIRGARSRTLSAQERQLHQALFEAAQRRDDAAYEAARQALSTYESAQAEARLTALLQRPETEVDRALIQQELQYRRTIEQLAPGPRGIVLHSDQIRDINARHGLDLGAHMGQLPLENGRPVGPAGLMSATTGEIRQEGRQLHFDFWLFHHIEFGWPAFMHYLCTQGCRDIKYVLADFNDVRGD